MGTEFLRSRRRLRNYWIPLKLTYYVNLIISVLITHSDKLNIYFLAITIG